MKAGHMLNTLKYFAVITAISVPSASHAQVMAPSIAVPQQQVVQAGYEDLKETDKRRLDFYAQKIVIEILATVKANEAGDTAGFNKHGNAMKSTAERYLAATEKAGLTEAEADFVFHQHLITGVRRQSFWARLRPDLREDLAHLVCLIMRRICGEASVAFRWSSV